MVFEDTPTVQHGSVLWSTPTGPGLGVCRPRQVLDRYTPHHFRLFRLLMNSADGAPSPAQPAEDSGTILSANAYMLMYRRRGWQYSGSLASKPVSLPDRQACEPLSLCHEAIIKAGV